MNFANERERISIPWPSRMDGFCQDQRLESYFQGSTSSVKGAESAIVREQSKENNKKIETRRQKQGKNERDSKEKVEKTLLLSNDEREAEGETEARGRTEEAI